MPAPCVPEPASPRTPQSLTCPPLAFVWCLGPAGPASGAQVSAPSLRHRRAWPPPAPGAVDGRHRGPRSLAPPEAFPLTALVSPGPRPWSESTQGQSPGEPHPGRCAPAHLGSHAERLVPPALGAVASPWPSAKQVLITTAASWHPRRRAHLRSRQPRPRHGGCWEDQPPTQPGAPRTARAGLQRAPRSCSTRYVFCRSERSAGILVPRGRCPRRS